MLLEQPAQLMVVAAVPQANLLAQYTTDIKMIRLANRADLPAVTELIVDFLQSTTYQRQTEVIDREHIKRLAFSILHQGYIWLYFVNDQPVGLLAAVKEQNIWVPIVTLRELVWYVKEEHRGTASAGKLFVKFCSTAEKLLNNKEISCYFTTRMTSTTDYDLERRGFRLTEKLYIKDN
jgi:L-amino acid N-acyltransferase YncA